MMSKVSLKVSAVAAALLIFFSTVACGAGTTKTPAEVCDVDADDALAARDYPTAIELHRRLLRSEGNKAVAHYHLGFAYGMLRQVPEEINEYRKAIGLGLNTWDLFMNLGLAYYDRREFANATAALETAVAIGPEHAETHFNLAVVYERENRLNEALQEIIAALVLAPRDLDAVNTDAIICARMGNVTSARQIWTQLLEAAPDYAPARANLALLNRSCGDACGREAGSHSELETRFGN
jgi:tetratricopeptide (TPR) repeat protein